MTRTRILLLGGYALWMTAALAACGSDSAGDASAKGADGADGTTAGDQAQAGAGSDSGAGSADGQSASAGTSDSADADADGDADDAMSTKAFGGGAETDDGVDSAGAMASDAVADSSVLRLAFLSTNVDAADDTLLVDDALVEYLRSLGHRVDRFRPEAAPSALMDRDAIFISSAADSARVDAAWATAPVPVLIWEFYALGQLAMTADLNGETLHDYAGGNEIEIVADDPLAAGLSGTVQISELGTGTLAVPVALPAAATVVANLAGDGELAGMPVYFYFREGDPMEGGVIAPAPRVALPLGLNQARTLNDAGRALVKEALTWSTAGRPRAVAPTTMVGPSTTPPLGPTSMDPTSLPDLDADAGVPVL